MSVEDPYPVPMTEEGARMLLVILAREIRGLTGKVETMTATMATKLELEALRTDLHKRIDALSTEVSAKSASSTFDRWLSMGTRLLVFCTVLVGFCGMVVAGVRYFDGLQQKQPLGMASPELKK